jgi:hypothetical protein
VIWDEVGQYSPWVLIGTVILAIVRGWMVPRRVMVDLVALWQKRAEDAEKRAEQWEAAFKAESKTSSMLAAQNGELLESGRLTQHIADSIPKWGEHRAGG